MMMMMMTMRKRQICLTTTDSGDVDQNHDDHALLIVKLKMIVMVVVTSLITLMMMMMMTMMTMRRQEKDKDFLSVCTHCSVVCLQSTPIDSSHRNTHCTFCKLLSQCCAHCAAFLNYTSAYRNIQKNALCPMPVA